MTTTRTAAATEAPAPCTQLPFRVRNRNGSIGVRTEADGWTAIGYMRVAADRDTATVEPNPACTCTA